MHCLRPLAAGLALVAAMTSCGDTSTPAGDGGSTSGTSTGQPSTTLDDEISGTVASSATAIRIGA